MCQSVNDKTTRICVYVIEYASMSVAHLFGAAEARQSISPHHIGIEQERVAPHRPLAAVCACERERMCE